jgi:hypothetical protein
MAGDKYHVLDCETILELKDIEAVSSSLGAICGFGTVYNPVILGIFTIAK